jgi:FAD/FMN-containing dehydrogenase
VIINRTGEKQWTNRHQTLTLPIDNLFDLGNNNSGNVLNDYNDATKGIQGVLQETIDAGKELRVLGGEWSWTKIAATTGILLNTKPLNLSFSINQNNVSPSYQLTPADLYFVQCGVSIKELTDRLANHNRSIKTSGASNGQTIAGAMSTGTHGAAIDVGSVADFVVGLHIITSPTEHIWLERKSYPVASDSFIAALDATPLRDDDLFNAAVVSFGSFGFIHGVMIESFPLFLYEAHRFRVPLTDDLFRLIETLDFAGSNFLPHGAERPYHFQTLINQYDQGNGAYVNIMYRRPFDPAHIPPGSSIPGISPGDDAPAFIGTITQAIPALVPKVINKLVAKMYKPYNGVLGTHGEIFTNFTTHGKVYSTAVGIPVSAVNTVRNLLVDLNRSSGPFAGIFAFRFVKGTRATLGFTHFDPTCVVELDGVFSHQTEIFYEAFWDALKQQQIPHSLHWGKMFRLDNQRIRELYGDDKINAWIAARDTILHDASTKKIFTNDLMREWEIDE